MLKSKKSVKIAWTGKHFGEEPPLTGDPKNWRNQGAGAIFFSGCNLRCVFCQNYQISQEDFSKKERTPQGLADIMLGLQNQGAINIDLVSPTIWVLQIKEAIALAKKKGLEVPIVWNSNAFESTALLKKMESLVDIYLPDFKYGDDTLALKYSNAKNYIEIAKNALQEMLRQVGNLQNEQGIAKKGVIVRHLVLPNNLENSFAALRIIAAVDKNIYLSLMNQYYPLHKAKEFPEINQRLPKEDFAKVCDYARSLGFESGWVQGEESCETLIPDFTKEKPFEKV